MTARSSTTIALLITFVLSITVTLRGYPRGDDELVRQLREQLQQTQAELAGTTAQLADARQKLGFLEASKARVQVTAYALTDDFGPDPLFSNNTPARKAFAVPKHTLPTGKILNVALSPAAEHKLHANLNDTIVLMSRNRRIALIQVGKRGFACTNRASVPPQVQSFASIKRASQSINSCRGRALPFSKAT